MNCTRLNDPPSTCASVLTVSVLARPGTPSSSTWPPASSATSRRSSIASWPTITRLSSYSASSSPARGSSRSRSARSSSIRRPGVAVASGRVALAGAAVAAVLAPGSRRGPAARCCGCRRRRRLLDGRVRAACSGASVAANAAGTPMASAPPAAAIARNFVGSMAASLPPHSSDPHKRPLETVGLDHAAPTLPRHANPGRRGRTPHRRRGRARAAARGNGGRRRARRRRRALQGARRTLRRRRARPRPARGPRRRRLPHADRRAAAHEGADAHRGALDRRARRRARRWAPTTT